MAVKKTTKPERKDCLACEKPRPLTEFYKTSYDNYFKDGKLPICKACIFKNIEENGFEEFQNLMKLINKPILDDLFKGDYKEYVKNVNSLPNYKHNTYEDSTLFKEVKSTTIIKKVKLTKLTEEELEDLIHFFGEGHEEKDYIYLKTEYNDYVNRYEVKTKAMENLVKEICLTQLDIRIKTANGDKVDAQRKTLQDLLGSSNLKPVQENAASGVSEAETFGTLIKKFENEHPIPEPDPSWKDVDGIGKYIRTFFLGTMAKMFDKENPYQDEYDDYIEEYTVRPPSNGDDE